MPLIKEPLLLAVLGIGVVFVVLAINYLLILLIGLFREQPQGDSVPDAQGLIQKPVNEDKRTTVADLPIAPATGPLPSTSGELESDFVDQELITVIMSAVCAYEAEKDYF